MVACYRSIATTLVVAISICGQVTTSASPLHRDQLQRSNDDIISVSTAGKGSWRLARYVIALTQLRPSEDSRHGWILKLGHRYPQEDWQRSTLDLPMRNDVRTKIHKRSDAPDDVGQNQPSPIRRERLKEEEIESVLTDEEMRTFQGLRDSNTEHTKIMAQVKNDKKAGRKTTVQEEDLQALRSRVTTYRHWLHMIRSRLLQKQLAQTGRIPDIPPPIQEDPVGPVRFTREELEAVLTPEQLTEFERLVEGRRENFVAENKARTAREQGRELTDQEKEHLKATRALTNQYEAMARATEAKLVERGLGRPEHAQRRARRLLIARIHSSLWDQGFERGSWQARGADQQAETRSGTVRTLLDQSADAYNAGSSESSPQTRRRKLQRTEGGWKGRRRETRAREPATMNCWRSWLRGTRARRYDRSWPLWKRSDRTNGTRITLDGKT